MVSVDPDEHDPPAAAISAASGAPGRLSRAVFAYNHAHWYVQQVLARRRCSAATSMSSSRSTSSESGSRRRRRPSPRRARRCGRRRRRQLSSSCASRSSTSAPASGTAALRRAGSGERRHSRSARRAPRPPPTWTGSGSATAAEKMLDQARDGAHAASFNPAAAGILEARPVRTATSSRSARARPSSASHTPTTTIPGDIAAPEGSPVYALADSIVLDAVDDDRCGIGILLQTADGIQWVYCHLSQRDPAVLPGDGALRRPVGRPRGLYRPTAPARLHLAVKPETSYPQEMPAPGVRRDRLHLAGLAGRRVSQLARLLVGGRGSDLRSRGRRDRVHH